MSNAKFRNAMNDVFVMFGTQITSPNDKLNKLSLFELYERIANPTTELKGQIQTLRTVLTFDENQYRRLKTKLPYFCTSVFTPPFRKSENFASASFFVLDIDHVSDSEYNLADLQMRIVSHPNIALMFVSPGNNGLKIVFPLAEKCFDKGKFSLFYKLFARKFAEQFGLMQIIDTRTSDVARACFLSADREAFFNPNAEPVHMSSYIDFDSLEQVHEAEIFASEQSTVPVVVPEIQPDILQQIKLRLNPKARLPREKTVFVPEKLNEVVSAIEERTAETGMKLASIENINFGKKLRFEAGLFWAELNVFYGKRGFSVVKTPKRGSSPDLADLAALMLSDMLIP